MKQGIYLARMLRIGKAGVTFVLAVLAFCCACAPNPSDDYLIEHFRAHRNDFAVLARMSRTDKVEQMLLSNNGVAHVSGRAVSPADALGPLRYAEYLRLFDKLGLVGVQWQTQTGTFLWAHSSPRERRGYLRVRNAKRAPDFPPGYTFRHIEDEWYLYRDEEGWE